MNNLIKLEGLLEAGFKGARKPRAEAEAFVAQIREYLQQLGIDGHAVIAGGSLRRGKSEIGDVDLVVNDPSVNKSTYQKLNDLLHQAGHKVEVRVMGDSHASILVDDFLLELKKSKPEYLGAMMLFVTGSGDWNMGMRAYAKGRGFALNQYGLSDRDTGKLVASRTEEEIFNALGVPYVRPENRVRFNPPGGREAPAVESPGKIPDAVMAKVPEVVKAQLRDFVLPATDERGTKIPDDFLWSKEARQQYYRKGGRFKIPDALKLDRY